MMECNRRSLGSLNSLAEDSLSTFNDTLTIYGHPKVRDVLRAFEQLQAVQVLHYRTALKLRCIQKKMELHRIDARDVMTVFSNHGLPPSNEEIGESEMEPIIADICLMMERHQSLDTTTVSCTDLVLTWLLQMFDRNYAGQITVRSFTLALVIICGGRLLDKYKYIYDLSKGPDGLLDQESFRLILSEVLMIPSSVFEEEHYGHPNVIFGAQYECFNQLSCERERISIDEFLSWASTSSTSLSWLSALHRLSASEYNVNLTACTVCNTAPYLGFRYIGLYSYNLHICQECAWTGHTEGDVELREYGALGTGINLTIVPTTNNSGSCLSLSDSHPLQDVYSRLDPDYDTLLNYSKRLAPQSVSNFIAIGQVTKDQDIDDATDALIYECDERAAKLDRDFGLLCKEHGEINKLERKRALTKLESLQVWKKRDDLSSRLCVWMARRNSLFIKEEEALKDLDIEVPDLSYQKSNGLGSVISLVSSCSTKSDMKRDSNALIESLSYKVPSDEAVMVMSKLTMIVNNALLQKSISESPQIKRVVTHSPVPEILKSPPQYTMDNGAAELNGAISSPYNRAQAVSSPLHEATNTLALSNPASPMMTPASPVMTPASPMVTPASPIVTPPSPGVEPPSPIVTPPSPGVVTNGSQEEAMKEFDSVMNDIIQATFNSTKIESPVFDRKDGPPEYPAPDPVRLKEEEEIEEFEEGAWETDEEGEWETEDEITVVTDASVSNPAISPTEPNFSLSDPNMSTIAPLPSDVQITINSGSDDPLEGATVSEPECDPQPPPRNGAPVPPPRSLMSPVGRRATSLKTKDGMPLEVKKAIRTSSNAADIPRKSGGSGIPPPKLSKKPLPTPSPSSKTPPNNTPEKGPIRAIKKPTPVKNRGPQRGPIVYEGSSNSETSSSTSSDSDWDEKRGKFTRFRSARFHRSKVPTPSRGTSSFKQKRNVKPPVELGFSNQFAE